VHALFDINGRETNSQVGVPILSDRKKKRGSTKKQRDGPKTIKTEKAWLDYILFLLMIAMAVIKSKYKTLARTNKVVWLPFYRRYRIKAYIKPITYSKKTGMEI